MDVVFEAGAIELQRGEVGLGHYGRGARASVEQRQLAEDGFGSDYIEHDALAGVIFGEDFGFAGFDDVEGIAGIAVVEDVLAGAAIHGFQFSG